MIEVGKGASAQRAMIAGASALLLLSSGASESPLAIDNKLKIFKFWERGLLATWETPDALICVPI
jgi:hypothetical protein